MFARSIPAAVLSGSLLFVPFAAPAGANGQQVTPASATPVAEHAHDGGIIAGKITSVDFQRNMIAVNRIEISVMPSTQIQGSDPAYHAITDLRPGMSVRVYTSQVAGKYIAQIITLR